MTYRTYLFFGISSFLSPVLYQHVQYRTSIYVMLKAPSDKESHSGLFGGDAIETLQITCVNMWKIVT